MHQTKMCGLAKMTKNANFIDKIAVIVYNNNIVQFGNVFARKITEMM